ncbi:MAG: hypothetical protein QM677_10660 [Microbacterium sp.]
MAISTPAADWKPLTPRGVAELLSGTSARWWLSGGVALDVWLGHPVRDRANIDISTVARDLGLLIEALPEGFTAWVPVDDDVVAWADADQDSDLQPVLIREESTGAWVLQVNTEDGSDAAWMYKRDPRLQLPWSDAVREIDGIPTGAPEVQLVWKALRPRPEDDIDKDAVLPHLPEKARAWYERTILTVHPHSTWSIHVRSPFAPAKASWNRPRG